MSLKRVAVFGCTHCPYQHDEWVTWAILEVRKWKPHHVVCLGDLWDATGVSKYDDDYSHTAPDEFKSGAVLLKAFRKASMRGADCHLLEGNHCRRFRKNAPKYFREGLKAELFDDEYKSWQQYPYHKRARGVCNIGPVYCFHGVRFGVNSDHQEAVEIGNMTQAPRGSLVLRSHTHRVTPIQKVRVGGINADLWCGNVGLLADPDKLEYSLERDVSQWGPGLALVDYSTTDNSWDGEIVYPEATHVEATRASHSTRTDDPAGAF